jgi:hypothetical protein
LHIKLDAIAPINRGLKGGKAVFGPTGIAVMKTAMRNRGCIKRLW